MKKWVSQIWIAAIFTLNSISVLAAKDLVFCSEGSPEGFNPQYFTTIPTFDASAVPIFNRLVQFEIGSTRIVPALAESWTISPNGLAYTFILRKGVKFHSNARFTPSRDFNADDVLFSYNRMADPKHPFHDIAPGQTYAFFDNMGMSEIIDRVEKKDLYTVVFHLRRPNAPFLANLTMAFMSLHSAEYAERMRMLGIPSVVDKEPIGTGPFQFMSYKKDELIRYKAFDTYWDGRPKIDNLTYEITPDNSVRYAKLKSGICHVMANPKAEDVQRMKFDPNITVLRQDGMNVGYISFNVQKHPFDNQLLRQALNLATDKENIVKTIFQGAGMVAKNPIPPSMWSYNDRVKDYPYNPIKAKTLLAKAGYPNGLTIDLWYLPISRPYNLDGKRMAELVQADWARVGVTTNLMTYEWTEYRRRSKKGEQGAMMFGWSGDNGDPDNFFDIILGCHAVAGGGNTARWCNKDYDTLIQQAKVSSNQAYRTWFYEKAQILVKEDAPWIPIAHSVIQTPVRKEVVGFKQHTAPPSHYFQNVDLVK